MRCARKARCIATAAAAEDRGSAGDGLRNSRRAAWRARWQRCVPGKLAELQQVLGGGLDESWPRTAAVEAIELEAGVCERRRLVSVQRGGGRHAL